MEVPDQLTIGASRNVAKPVEPSLDELHRNASEAEAAAQCHSWYAIYAPHV